MFCKLEIVVAHVFGWHTLFYKIHIWRIIVCNLSIKKWN